MTAYEKESFIGLKYFLLLVAIIFGSTIAFLVIVQSFAATATGSSPDMAISLTSGVSTGILGPGQRRWFRVTPDQHQELYQNMQLSMFFTTDTNNPRHQVNFELFTANDVIEWQRGNKSALSNFGAGMPVSRDGDLRVGERIWQGTVLRDETYYLTVDNGSSSRVDYWLVDDDVMVAEMEVQSENESVMANQLQETLPAQGSAPHVAIPLIELKNTGNLAPGEETWYSFSVDKSKQEQFEPVALTLIFTPDDGSRIRHVTMDVFTPDAVVAWLPGGNTEMNNIGAGSIVYRDKNPLTGERFWNGWVVNNDLYYVRVKNSADLPVDYWLFTGDVYSPEL